MIVATANSETLPERTLRRAIASGFCVLVNSSDQACDVFEIVYGNSETMWRGCEWPRFVGFTGPHRSLYGFEAVASNVAGGWREQLGAQLDSLPAKIDYVLRLEEELADALGATVEVRVKKATKRGGQSGELAIHFDSLDALSGILDKLRGS